MSLQQPQTPRNQVLEAAALRLLTGPSDSEQLDAMRSLLAPIAADAGEPAWVRDALASALDLLAQAANGTADPESVTRRVGKLLELVGSGSAPADAAPSTMTCAFPIETARELLPQFVAESLDSLEQAERALLELEANPAAKEALDVVFRAFHTIKSTSAFFGLEAVSTLAHETESVLCSVRDGRAPFDRRIADLSFASADMMRALLHGVDAVLAGDPFDTPAGYRTLLDELRQKDAPVVAAAAPAISERTNAGAAESWIRVRTERLDQLLDLVGELVVAHSMVAADEMLHRDRQGPLTRKVQQTSKIVRELQGLSMSLRMVPLRPVFQKMRRLVRDLSQSTGKLVEFRSEGEATELDRHMVEALADPLVHMIRNAIDHGIESAAERAAAGKPADATLRLTAAHEGGSVVVTLTDDGRGLDEARIVASAIERGIIEQGRNLSDSEIHELIFRPGLSTNTKVTELSGRGVGMDVVARNIAAMNGRIEITSQRGAGTTFTIRLPLTRAITDGMLVRVGSERYILPTAEIQTSFRPAADSLATAGGDGELVMLHGQALGIVRLHHVLGIAGAVTDPARALLVVLGDKEGRYALLVDELLGQQQFVAKPVAAGTANVQGIAGGAILADGRVGLILDPAGLFAASRRLPPAMGAA